MDLEKEVEVVLRDEVGRWRHLCPTAREPVGAFGDVERCRFGQGCQGSCLSKSSVGMGGVVWVRFQGNN